MLVGRTLFFMFGVSRRQAPSILQACEKRIRYCSSIVNASEWEDDDHQVSAVLEKYLDGDILSAEERRCVDHVIQGHGVSYHPNDVAGVLKSVYTTRNDVGFPKGLHSMDFGQHVSGPGVDDALARHDIDTDHRINLLDMETITIDDASTVEIDDALSARETERGVEVFVHIADPTRWLHMPDHVLAVEARQRTRTVYLPDGKIPMFPSRFGTDVCSLREDALSPALTMHCCIREDGSIIEHSMDVFPSNVSSNKRLTYDMVDRILLEDNNTMVSVLHRAAERRERRRGQDGAQTLHIPESSLSVSYNEDTKEKEVTLTRVSNDIASASRRLVSEMMILAGDIVARVGSSLSLPLPYRGQEMPVRPSNEELEQIPEGICRSYYMRKFMLSSLTRVSHPIHHTGLGLPGYVQATSPIRRYGDMLAHWQIKSALRGDLPLYDAESLQTVVDEVQKTSKRIAVLERSVDDYWMAVYFQRHREQNPHHPWSGILLNWIRQEYGLAAVYVDDIGREVTCRIHMPTMVGQPVTVYCTHADPLTRQVVFSDAILHT
eukprot:jgi/Picre1/27668/NNA_000632.t1